MAELSTIARPYARAAFESANALRALAPWSEAMTRAAAVVATSASCADRQSPCVADRADRNGVRACHRYGRWKGQASRPRSAEHRTPRALSPKGRGRARTRSCAISCGCWGRTGACRCCREIAVQFEALRAEAEKSPRSRCVAPASSRASRRSAARGARAAPGPHGEAVGAD